MKKVVLTLAMALIAASAFAAPESFSVDKVHSEATFKIRHMMSKVTGKFDDFSGNVSIDREKPAASTVDFTIRTASVDTGVADRDKHLRSEAFFDAEKNPEITFKSETVAPSGKQNVYNVTGNLTMRGVTKKVTLPVEFLGFMKDPWGNERAGFAIATTINRKDYGINWNQALDNGGFLLADDVDIAINLETVKAKAK